MSSDEGSEIQNSSKNSSSFDDDHDENETDDDSSDETSNLNDDYSFNEEEMAALAQMQFLDQKCEVKI